ncbi:MAG: hypothetical protein ACRDF4_11505, partial [Rhabdochlamydiaceae bacterium]
VSGSLIWRATVMGERLGDLGIVLMLMARAQHEKVDWKSPLPPNWDFPHHWKTVLPFVEKYNENSWNIPKYFWDLPKPTRSLHIWSDASDTRGAFIILSSEDYVVAAASFPFSRSDHIHYKELISACRGIRVARKLDASRSKSTPCAFILHCDAKSVVHSLNKGYSLAPRANSIIQSTDLSLVTVEWVAGVNNIADPYTRALRFHLPHIGTLYSGMPTGGNHQRPKKENDS